MGGLHSKRTRLIRWARPTPPLCPPHARLAAGLVTLVSLFFACSILYSLAYIWTMWRTFRHLLKLPYNTMRRANVVVRIQVRMRALTIGFYILSAVSVRGGGAGPAAAVCRPPWAAPSALILPFCQHGMLQGCAMVLPTPAAPAVHVHWPQLVQYLRPHLAGLHARHPGACRRQQGAR